MKLQISESAAGSLATLAVASRIVSGVVIDIPDLLNAGWLSILIGALLALPLMLATAHIRRTHSNQPTVLPRPLSAVFFTLSVWDAAAVASILADSAGYLALNRTASIYLMIPQFVLCLCCLQLNGDALGASAAIWNKFLPVLLLIVILLQSDSYRPEWLTPLLGAGWTSVFSGALRTAGWFSLPTGLFLVAKPDVQGRPGCLRPPRLLAISAAFAIPVTLVFSMMTPALPDQNLFSRTFRFDALLANGRNGLALQLPTIAIWYPGLFYALLFDVFSGAIMLQHLLPQWPHSACVWVSLICTALLAASRYSEQKAVMLASSWLLITICASTAAYMLLNWHRKGAKPHA